MHGFQTLSNESLNRKKRKENYNRKRKKEKTGTSLQTNSKRMKMEGKKKRLKPSHDTTTWPSFINTTCYWIKVSLTVVN